jgi:UDP-N-acetylmuramoyl-tripeptide--D-alanyl-D-alanine ligase
MSTTAPARRSLAAAVEAMAGDVLVAPTPLSAATYVGGATDDRNVTPGRLFFALLGERVDGHAFCGTAVAKGAVGVVIARGRPVPAGCEGAFVIAVDDPRLALGALARRLRAEFQGRVIGVTGSNGKTTTKELIAAALSSAGSVARTAGNFNTDVGLPLTILETTGQESFWVLEMAMRGLGQIAYLAAVGRPHVAVITNVGAAHLELLGSLENIARAKGEIYGGLEPDGIAILPAGAPLVEAQAAHLPDRRKLRFGAVGPKPTGARADTADVRILEFLPAGAAGSVVRMAVADEPVVVRLPLAGEHNARNAAAALAVAVALRVPVLPAAAALAGTALPAHRSSVLEVAGRSILDDCYNANPGSMAAAIATVASLAGGNARAYAILGDMRELGPEAEGMHVEMGREVAARRLAGVVGVGPMGAHIARGAREAGVDASRAVAVSEPAEAARLVAGWAGPGDWVLVKASRGMQLERAVEALAATLRAAAG